MLISYCCAIPRLKCLDYQIREYPLTVQSLYKQQSIYIVSAYGCGYPGWLVKSARWCWVVVVVVVVVVVRDLILGRRSTHISALNL